MKKLLPLAIGATLTVLTASPVWADDGTSSNVEQDMATVVQDRAALERNMADLARQMVGGSTDQTAEAVLGEQAIPVLGFEAPLQVKRDMLQALRDTAQKNRDLAAVPGGGSRD